jgi:hypothetical protein
MDGLKEQMPKILIGQSNLFGMLIGRSKKDLWWTV